PHRRVPSPPPRYRHRTNRSKTPDKRHSSYERRRSPGPRSPSTERRHQRNDERQQPPIRNNSRMKKATADKDCLKHLTLLFATLESPAIGSGVDVPRALPPKATDVQIIDGVLEIISGEPPYNLPSIKTKYIGNPLRILTGKPDYQIPRIANFNGEEDHSF